MGTKKAKKGDTKVITMQEAGEEKSEVGGAVQGTKRKRTNGDEEKEKTDGNGSVDLKDGDGVDALGGKLNEEFET